MKNFVFLGIPVLQKGSGIHIKKKNRGKFTEYCGGEVTQECINRAKKSKNPILRKRGIFAENSRKWKHQEGGIIQNNTQQPKLDNSEWYNSMLSKNYTPIKLKDGTYTFKDNKGNYYYNNGRVKLNNGVISNYDYRNITPNTQKQPYSLIAHVNTRPIPGLLTYKTE